MNPHKVIDPYLPLKTCAWARTINPSHPKPIFKFPEDYGSFAKAAQRCIGLGAACKKRY